MRAEFEPNCLLCHLLQCNPSKLCIGASIFAINIPSNLQRVENEQNCKLKSSEKVELKSARFGLLWLSHNERFLTKKKSIFCYSLYNIIFFSYFFFYFFLTCSYFFLTFIFCLNKPQYFRNFPNCHQMNRRVFEPIL